MDKQIIISHTIYRKPNRRVGGASLSTSLETLLRNAEWTLARKDGWFFEVIDDELIIGFLISLETEMRGGEYFFNVFAMDKDVIYDINIRSLINKLSTHTINDPDEHINESFKIELSSETHTFKSKPELFADICLSMHQDEPSAITLNEFSAFVSTVENATEYARVISDVNKETEYFYFVNEKINRNPDSELVELIEMVDPDYMTVKNLFKLCELVTDRTDERIEEYQKEINSLNNRIDYMLDKNMEILERNRRFMILLLLINIILILTLIFIYAI